MRQLDGDEALGFICCNRVGCGTGMGMWSHDRDVSGYGCATKIWMWHQDWYLALGRGSAAVMEM